MCAHFEQVSLLLGVILSLEIEYGNILGLSSFSLSGSQQYRIRVLKNITC